jgi:carnitine O-acetyltransferase
MQVSCIYFLLYKENVFQGRRGHNRWFEKAISLVVDNTGRAGCNGEHSPLDAVVPAQMFDNCVKREPAVDPPSVSNKPLSAPKKLSWVIDREIEDDLVSAQKAIDAVISDSDVQVIHFQGYGSNFIKKFARVSPDAFIQQSLQLAYYKIHGKFAPVYESSSTRQYLYGRTETCRSLTVAQRDFVLGFCDKNVAPKEKYRLLSQACSAHVAYISNAMNGKGCDRQLLGYKLMLQAGEDVPEIFKDPSFSQSTAFQLSSSGLFASEYIMATGFGAGVREKGYGMNYIVLKDMIKVGLESKKSGGSGSERYARVLQEVWKEMEEMCKSGGVDAKL